MTRVSCAPSFIFLLLLCGSPGQALSVWNRLRRQSRSSTAPSIGYVPDGLTTEEYQRIKQKEADELRRKDFGAFGPRFRKNCAPPEGDWMLMRSLWTTGTVAAPRNSLDIGRSRKRDVIPSIIYTYGPSVTLSAWIVHMVLSGASAYRKPPVSFPKALELLLVPTVSHIQNAILHSLVVALAIFPVNRFMSMMNRRRLWGRRRSILITFAASTMAWTLWTMGVVGIHKILS